MNTFSTSEKGWQITTLSPRNDIITPSSPGSEILRPVHFPWTETIVPACKWASWGFTFFKIKTDWVSGLCCSVSIWLRLQRSGWNGSIALAEQTERAEAPRTNGSVCVYCVFLNVCVCVRLVAKVKARPTQRPDVCACFSGLLAAELKGVSWCWWRGQPLLKSICFSFLLAPAIPQVALTVFNPPVCIAGMFSRSLQVCRGCSRWSVQQPPLMFQANKGK